MAPEPLGPRLVLRDERAVIPIGSYNPKYGVTLSVPSVLGREGVVHTLDPVRFFILSVMLRGALQSWARPRDRADRTQVTYIDSAILNATEWFCRKFQLLTGRTNAWLAVQITNLSIIVYFVWAAMYFSTADLTLRIAVGLFCGGVFYALTQTVFKVPIEEYENNAYRRVAKGFRNPRRVRDALLRTAFLTLSIVLCGPILFVYVNLHVRIVLLSYFLVILTTVLLYLLACDPLPPCPGKVREWLRGAAPSPIRAPESSTAD